MVKEYVVESGAIKAVDKITITDRTIESNILTKRIKDIEKQITELEARKSEIEDMKTQLDGLSP